MPRGGLGPSARFPAPAPGATHPERRVDAYYLQRTQFESIAERKLRRRQLAEDGNVEISRAGLALGAKSRRLPGLPQTTAIEPQRSLVRTRGLGLAVVG